MSSKSLVDSMFRKWQDDDERAEELLEAQVERAASLQESTRELFESFPPPAAKSSSSSSRYEYVIRKPSETELGLLYNWLFDDEARYSESAAPGKVLPPNPAPYWTKAGKKGALQAHWEERCSGKCAAKGFHRCNQLLCAFPLDTDYPFAAAAGTSAAGRTEEGAAEEGTAARLPVSFVILKDDGVTIDALGTYTAWRGRRAAQMLAQYCMHNLAFLGGHIVEGRERGNKPTVYCVDSLISALTFWRSLGFVPVKAADIPKSKMADLEFFRPVVYHFGPKSTGRFEERTRNDSDS